MNPEKTISYFPLMNILVNKSLGKCCNATNFDCT